jgi:hypothetical protein
MLPILFTDLATWRIFYYLNAGGFCLCNFCWISFRTCARERGHLVLQIGTANADRAAQVAKKLEQGVEI